MLLCFQVWRFRASHDWDTNAARAPASHILVLGTSCSADRRLQASYASGKIVVLALLHCRSQAKWGIPGNHTSLSAHENDFFHTFLSAHESDFVLLHSTIISFCSMIESLWFHGQNDENHVHCCPDCKTEPNESAALPHLVITSNHMSYKVWYIKVKISDKWFWWYEDEKYQEFCVSKSRHQTTSFGGTRHYIIQVSLQIVQTQIFAVWWEIQVFLQTCTLRQNWWHCSKKKLESVPTPKLGTMAQLLQAASGP